MEESEVIDIDDLLVSETTVGQHDAEEYNFENFSNEGETTLDLPSTNVTSEALASSSASTQGCLKQQIAATTNHQAKRASRKTSLEDDLKKLFLSSKSSKRKLRESESSLVSNTNLTSKKDVRAVDEDEQAGSYSDAKVSQNEALVDAFVQGELSDAVLSEEELCIDVNSEQLRQFILEFEANGEGVTDNPPVDSTAGRGHQKQAIMLINHRQIQSDDQDSLNSSISTTESHNGSLTSSLASSDLSPIRIKQKVPRGKSVRFLMSNLLRNNKAQHHPHTSRTSGSDDDAKDAKRVPTKPPKERSKKRDKEERERERITKQHSKISKTHQSNTASSSSKTVAQSALHIQPRRSGDRVLDSNTQPKSQFSTTTVATPLNPVGRDNTLHKQLIQAAGRGDLQVLEFLLAANEGLSEVRDNRGNTLLHAVARRGHVDCLAWLAAGPCSRLLLVENEDYFTAAALAVKHGQVECANCLAEHPDVRAELHAQDHRWSLLHLAARFGQETCLRWLLEHMQAQEISLDQTDHNNNSPAHLAAKYGHLQCLQTLVEFNSDVTLLNKKRQSPCTLATRYHHDTCAQFLVVVETCIKLSAELTVTQRKLRESQQEKEGLAKKLREALSCTDALVHMQKTDMSQQIEQVQGDYVDLTNLLVRQLDQMHQNQFHSLSHAAASTISRGDVLVSKQKAHQLGKACSELLVLDQCQQEESNDDQLREIERRLRRLQPLPTSPIWPTRPTELSTDLALSSMRARLSEVNHQISTLHQPSPSLASDNLDTLSLSSSYASSLSSSSSSSLQTGVVQTSPGDSAKKRRISWNEEPSKRGTMENSEIIAGTRTNAHKTQNTVHVEQECEIAKSIESDLCDLSRDTRSQRSGVSHTPEFEIRENTNVQYSKGGSVSETKYVIGNSKPVQTKPNVLCVQASIEQWEPTPQHDSETGHDSRSPVGNSHKERLECSGEVTGKSFTPSYEESWSRHSRNPLGAESSTVTGDTAKRKAEPVLRKFDERQNHLDQTHLKSSQSRTVSSPRGELPTPEPYVLPTFDKPQQNSDNFHQVSAKHYMSQQKHSQQAMPGFMRKVQPTNEFGEPESGKVVVKISNREEMVLLPTQPSTNQEQSTHQRAGSNSSTSSMSSDLPCSESDPDESPHLNRQPHRAGILSRKSTDGNKKSQDKHITFALDDEIAKPNTTGQSAGGKPQPNKRRDLSPIYEAPDLVKSTNDEAKTQNRVTQKSDKKDGNSPSIDTQKANNSLESDIKSPIGERDFHLFRYSSDEADYEGPDSHKTQKTSPARDQDNLKYPDGLTDAMSVEFNGLGGSDEISRCRKEDRQEKLWYESSDDEDDQDDQDDQDGSHHLHVPSSGNFERHICYL